jgi:hypothetical protein
MYESPSRSLLLVTAGVALLAACTSGESGRPDNPGSGGAIVGGSGGSGDGGKGTGGSGSGGSGSGGAAAATGGRSGATGGSPAGTGGSSTGTGGASTGSGGSPTGTGGSPTGTGGGGGLPTAYGSENTGADCAKPPLPAFGALTSVANLPDPFLMTNGTRITNRSDWRCRRAEIGAQIQNYETGTKPAPPTNETATFSGGKLSVTVTAANGKSITLTTTITTPSGAGPFPAVIGMDAGDTGSLPSSIFTSRGIATMTFTSSQLTPQSPGRGQGAIYSLYPDSSVGSMILWAWGVSRIIDGLAMTASQNKIDLQRIAVTGCSYAGKMALYAGAFDERIALTIPEESGGGGEAAWRVSATKTGTEDLEHAQGTSWYSSNLMQFKNADAPKLPFDQHELAAMVAPRALLTIGNPDIDYLSSEAGYVSIKAATEVYKALGVPDRVGYSQVGGHMHCMFPSSQTPDVSAFVDKFLVGKTDANTNVATSPYKTDLTRWITWSTPQLQ